jgi:hypothetical protein
MVLVNTFRRSSYPPERKVVKRRIAGCAATAIVTLVAMASPAGAAQPVREPLNSTSTATVTTLCAFPVSVTFQFTGERLSLYDGNGTLSRLIEHGVERDTYTANGKILDGLPYTFNVQAVFDKTGKFETLYTSGMVTRVPLPDGSVFRAAGRIDFVAHSFEFVAVPDWGTPANTAALCAALSS